MIKSDSAIERYTAKHHCQVLHCFLRKLTRVVGASELSKPQRCRSIRGVRYLRGVGASELLEPQSCRSIRVVGASEVPEPQRCRGLRGVGASEVSEHQRCRSIRGVGASEMSGTSEVSEPRSFGGVWYLTGLPATLSSLLKHHITCLHSRLS